MARYRIRFFFNWQCTPFWSGNDEAQERFGYAIELDELPLSPETVRRVYELAEWHDTALNWDYPPDPGPWRQPECDRFNTAVRALFEAARDELGADFDLVNEQDEFFEDPDLDAYLRDPKTFRRPPGRD